LLKECRCPAYYDPLKFRACPYCGGTRYQHVRHAREEAMRASAELNIAKMSVEERQELGVKPSQMYFYLIHCGRSVVWIKARTLDDALGTASVMGINASGRHIVKTQLALEDSTEYTYRSGPDGALKTRTYGQRAPEMEYKTR
jgi:hypothetical protein